MPVGGQPLVVWAIKAALACQSTTAIVVLAPPGHVHEMSEALNAGSVPHDVRSSPDGALSPNSSPAESSSPSPSPSFDTSDGVDVQVVEGGAQRSDSVLIGLQALPDDVGIVLVHDAARALAPVDVFDRVVDAVRSGHASVIPVVAVTDTIKRVGRSARLDGPASGSSNSPYSASGAPAHGEWVLATMDRSDLRAAQTPQGFLRETLAHAHAHVPAAGLADAPATDDAGMVEAMGATVFAVAGHPRSMKITSAHDLAVAQVWLREDR